MKSNFELFIDIENEIIKQISILYPELNNTQKSYLITGLIIEVGGWSKMVDKIKEINKKTNSLFSSIQKILILNKAALENLIETSKI